MEYIIDSETMKEIEKYTIDHVGLPAMVFMERAALAVADEIIKHVTKNSRIISICGPGNNGGDGICVARILKLKGYNASIYMCMDLEKSSQQNKIQLEIAKKLGVRIKEEFAYKEYDVIIDGLLGIGLTRDVEGDMAEAIKKINSAQMAKKYSIDIPSGVCADTGKVRGIAVKADKTITFAVIKQGIIFYPGCEYAGEIKVADIGISRKAVEYIICSKPYYSYHFVEKSLYKLLPMRKNDSNKGCYGKVLIVAGAKNMAGAAYLAAKAAYKAGAGLVKIFTCEENRVILQTKIPEAILVSNNCQESLYDICQSLLEAVDWADSIAIGPGLGKDGIAKQILETVLKNATGPVVVDADAIHLLAEMDIGELCKNVVITPHLKEMSDLTKIPLSEIKSNLFHVASKTLYERYPESDIITVLKDARTLVSDGKRVYINTSGNHGMATAGSGDVLTGIVAAFLGVGLENIMAASLAVYVHGLAGDYYANQNNPYSLMAENIIESLDKVLIMKEGQ